MGRTSHGSTTCPNCGVAMATPYCGSCGQKAVHGRLDLHEVMHDATHALVHADIGLWRLLTGLALRPAATYRDYLAGARKKYFNPVLFLLLVEGIYIVAASAVIRRAAAVTGSTPQMAAELAVLQADKLKYFLAIPIVSLIAWLFFRARYHLAEILVFWCLCFGFMTAADMIGFPLQYLLPAQRESIKYAFGWIAGLLMAWHIFAFFGARAARTIAACVALTLITQVTVNYAYRTVYFMKGFDVPMGIVPTLRDSFGL